MSISAATIASYKQFYQGQPGTAAAVLYTAPANNTNVPSPYSTAVINEIILTNTSSTAYTVTIYVGGSAGTNAIIAALQVAANDTKVISGMRTAIPAGSTIQGLQQTAAAITVTISGAELQ